MLSALGPRDALSVLFEVRQLHGNVRTQSFGTIGSSDGALVRVQGFAVSESLRAHVPK